MSNVIHANPDDDEPDEYERKREAEGKRQRKIAASSREIGPIPNIADLARREACRTSLELFDLTYNPEAFTLPFCDDHRSEIKRVEEAVFHGALYAFAEPRGSGKTTRCRMAALWAASYHLSRYVFVIGANDDKAQDTLAAVKMFVRFLPLYATDFPDVAFAVARLEGIANRSAGQTCDGKPTMIEWAADRIVLPTVPPPKNWPAHWPLRSDGMVPTSGSIIGVSGLTGEGIRGSVKTLTTGEQVRPDFVLIDDPQTHDSARSKLQNQTRYELITADVLGMAGPGKAISAVMPCTVICRGDFIDTILNRTRHPLWRGERTQMLRSMPANLEAWDGYFEVYQRGALAEPPDFTEANAHYIEHREELDYGAEASWAERKLPGEVSAIQHAMHLYCRDRSAFFSEYQNDPEVELLPGQIEDLDPIAIANKFNGAPRGEMAPDHSRLTAFIDVHGTVLFWCVCGWAEGFASGAVIDYGVFPRQNRPYFAADDARPALADLKELQGFDETARLYAGLQTLTDSLASREFLRNTGEPQKLEVILIDAGWKTDLVHQFCRQSPHSAILRPSMGHFIGASTRPMASWKKEQAERRSQPGSPGWVLRVNTEGKKGKTLLFDSNAWKTFVADRILTPMAGRGCLSLFGKKADEHRLFADHLCSEFRLKLQGRDRWVEEWKKKPAGGDNHWLDALVGCAVGASFLGLAWSASGTVEPKKKREPQSMKALFEAAQAKRA